MDPGCGLDHAGFVNVGCCWESIETKDEERQGEKNKGGG